VDYTLCLTTSSQFRPEKFQKDCTSAPQSGGEKFSSHFGRVLEDHMHSGKWQNFLAPTVQRQREPSVGSDLARVPFYSLQLLIALKPMEEYANEGCSRMLNWYWCSNSSSRATNLQSFAVPQSDGGKQEGGLARKMGRTTKARSP